jgi:methyl-accepting chemotaxis protein
MSKDERRNIKLISRDFQLRLIIEFVLINVLILVVFGILIYLFLDSEIAANLSRAHVTYKNISDMLVPIVLTLSVLNIFVTSFIIAIVVLYSSHRIAGPLYRFNEIVKAVLKGNLNPMTDLRKDDQLKLLADNFKMMVEQLNQDISRMKTITNQVLADADKKKKAEILNELHIIKSTLDKYHTSPDQKLPTQ